MHIVISHAAAPGPRCRAASATLQLGHLQTLLPQLRAKTLHTGSPDSLTPLAEHLASGQLYPDGLVPWAAWLAQAHGLFQNGQHWALISPCHLQIHSDHVAMQDPSGLELTEDESRTLMAAMQPYFEEDGIALHWHSPASYLAQGQVFQDLASASLARVRAQPIDPWIPRQSAAQGLRRLQNEMQMLLYTHAVNDHRAIALNSIWFSGTGDLPPSTEAAPRAVMLHEELREAWLSHTPTVFLPAFKAVVNDLIAPALMRDEQVLLCNPQRSVLLEAQTPNVLRRLQQRWRPVLLSEVLQ